MYLPCSSSSLTSFSSNISMSSTCLLIWIAMTLLDNNKNSYKIFTVSSVKEYSCGFHAEVHGNSYLLLKSWLLLFFWWMLLDSDTAICHFLLPAYFSEFLCMIWVTIYNKLMSKQLLLCSLVPSGTVKRGETVSNVAAAKDGLQGSLAECNT